ncbi:MAG: hypothetical protein GC202_08855 [Alphaproteobacteria bacterium]|nr:hypothetical protein [Alphaproteobacteria bacterium]
MPTRIFTGFAWIAFLFWSLLCFGFWAVFSLGSDLVHWIVSNLFGAPDNGAIATALQFLSALGGALITWVWIAGSALIVFFGFMLRRAAGNATTIRVATFRTGDWEVREMKDVTPPRADASDAPRLPER